MSKHGDEVAFNKLVDLWFKRIYNFALKFFADHDKAMEVAQQTFIAAHQKLGQLKDVSCLKPWLYKIAINFCRQEDRKNKKSKWLSIFDHQDANQVKSAVGLPEEEYRKREQAEFVQELLSRLPEEQKSVLIMKEMEGMKFREIATVLDISENTVKSRLYYGLATLRKYLKERNYEF